MSLDVYLINKGNQEKTVTSLTFNFQDGTEKTITAAAWEDYFPDSDLQDIFPQPKLKVLYCSNITHNLDAMAEAAGIYKHLWRPEEIEVTKGSDLIVPLEEGLKRLLADPVTYQAYNASNGWGLYEHFVEFVEEYLVACKDYPEAEVKVSR